MKKTGLVFVLALLTFTSFSQQDYKVLKSYQILSPGGWDYLAIHQNKLYVSHGTQVNILDEATGDSVGVIPNTLGVHGIAFDNALGRGYTSNGRANNVTVFDIKTNQVLTQIATGENPDAILFEPFSKTIITCNGRSKNLSLIDPRSNKVLVNIDVAGKPETAVADGRGKLFVNLEDRNEIVEVDLQKRSVSRRWPLGAEGPTGLAYDAATQRLFAGCDGKLVVVNAATGAVVNRLPIGDGCDGVAFDARKKIIYTSNGQSGTITAIQEKAANQYTVLGNYASKRGARTIAIDESTGRLYLPTAEFEAGTPQGERPRMIPGTFQVLVVGN